MKVLIVGAGTGGLALAHKLKSAGVDVSVFERDLVPNADTGGYRVGISPGGSRALKSCLPPDLFDLFVATSARAPRHIIMLTERFSKLVQLDFEGTATDEVDGEKNVIRGTLRRVLLRGLEDHVAFGKAFERYSVQSDGTVTAYFQDGGQVTGDILVGADGTGSAVRKQRLPEAGLEDTGMASFGGKLPMTTESRALLSPAMLQGMSMIMAPKGFGAIVHSLEFGSRRADSSVATRWPDFVAALGDDSIGWAIWGALRNFPQDPTTMNGEQLQELGLAVTRDWAPQMRRLIAMTEASAIHYVNVRTSVPTQPWESSTVTLLGDAIHTMTPGRGAGANTALRDAVMLGDALIDARRGRCSVIEAIHAYENEMRRYSAEAVLESRKQMNANDLIHKPVIGDLLLALMRGSMRIIDVVPPIKRRIVEHIMRVRGEN